MSSIDREARVTAERAREQLIDDAWPAAVRAVSRAIDLASTAWPDAYEREWPFGHPVEALLGAGAALGDTTPADWPLE